MRTPTETTADGGDTSREAIGSRDLGQWPSRLGRFLVAVVRVLVGMLAPVVRWSLGHIALVVTLVVGGTVAVLLTQAAGEIYEAVVDSDGVALLDQPVLDAMVGMRSPGLDGAVTAFTHIGGPIGMPALATVLTLALALVWRRWTPVVLVIAAAAGSLLMTVTGKTLTARTRPPESLAVPPWETSASFPSGHTLNAVVVVGVLVYLLLIRARHSRRVWAATAVGAAFVVLMGLSRVYLGHHWLSDVLAAWLFGLGWLTVVITAHRLMITLGRARPLVRADPAE